MKYKKCGLKFDSIIIQITSSELGAENDKNQSPRPGPNPRPPIDRNPFYPIHHRRQVALTRGGRQKPGSPKARAGLLIFDPTGPGRAFFHEVKKP